MDCDLSGLTTRAAHRRGWMTGGVFAALLLAAAPAYADFCIQVDGGPFSGDLGFFRFKGGLSNGKGRIAALRGRVAGLGPVYGTVVNAQDGSYAEIGATFFVDAEEGQIDITFSPPKSKNGTGYGDYGAYGTGASLTAKRVSCGKEP
jgi:hypothetical protein